MKVKLKKEHTHDNVVYQPGAVLDVDTECGEWLVAQQVAVPADEPPVKKSKKED